MCWWDVKAYSLTHSLTDSLTHSLTHPLTHSLIHSATHSVTHSLTGILSISKLNSAQPFSLTSYNSRSWCLRVIRWVWSKMRFCTAAALPGCCGSAIVGWGVYPSSAPKVVVTRDYGSPAVMKSKSSRIKGHLYSAICRKRIRGACWAGLGRLFTFAVCSAKEFGFQSTTETTERLNDSADLQLYDSEFQTDGALTLKAFADNASVIRGTDSNSLSADRRVRDGW